MFLVFLYHNFFCKNLFQITREFDMIMQQKESYQSFHNAWLTKWVPSILAVADADGIQYHESKMQEMEDLPEADSALPS